MWLIAFAIFCVILIGLGIDIERWWIRKQRDIDPLATREEYAHLYV